MKKLTKLEQLGVKMAKAWVEWSENDDEFDFDGLVKTVGTAAHNLLDEYKKMQKEANKTEKE